MVFDLPYALSKSQGPDNVLDDDDDDDEGDSYAELSREDSFPVAESILPSTFDLLAEPYPIVLQDSQSSETCDVSQLDTMGETSIQVRIYSTHDCATRCS